VLGELGRELCAALGRYHTERPHELGQSVETARAELAERVGRELAALVIERAAKEGSVLLDQDLLALPEFAKSAGAAAQKSDGRLLGELDKALLQGVTENELATRLGDKPQNVRAGLGRLQGAGRARRLGGMWFAEGQIDTLRERVRHYLQETQKMNVSDFKTLAGVSRKQAIPLLEQFDREGTTRRQGDERVLGAGKGGPK
jgi:selenocysteine-specific elongation factor